MTVATILQPLNESIGSCDIDAEVISGNQFPVREYQINYTFTQGEGKRTGFFPFATIQFRIDIPALLERANQLQQGAFIPKYVDYLIEKHHAEVVPRVWPYSVAETNYQELAQLMVESRGHVRGKKFGI